MKLDFQIQAPISSSSEKFGYTADRRRDGNWQAGAQQQVSRADDARYIAPESFQSQLLSLFTLHRGWNNNKVSTRIKHDAESLKTIISTIR